jgi:signal transduction histidine kinase
VIGELFWAISDGVVLMGPDGVTGWNPVAEQMFGVSSEGAMRPGFSVSALFGLQADRFQKIVDSDGREILEGVGPSDLSLEVSSRPLSSDPGTRVIVMRDVTSERKHLQRLLKLNEMARLVLSDDSLESVLQQIVDCAKELTGAEYSALLMLRDESDVEVSRFIYNAPRELFPDRLPRAVGLLAVPLQTRAPARLDDIRGHPAGVGIPVEHPPIAALLAVPLIFHDEVFGELAVANPPERRSFDEADEGLLTELALHAAEALRLAKSKEQTMESEESRRALIDVLRHDIATPIAVARGCVDQLANRLDQLTEEQKNNVLSALERAVVGLERLSANLRSDVKLEDPGLRADFVPIERTALVADLRGDIEDFAAQRGVYVHFDTEGDVPKTFMGSPLLVRQAIENLLTNAVKYSPSGASVTVTTRMEGPSIRFDVRDEGPGIAPAEQATLFDRFGKSPGATGRIGAGLGLGLSIVRRVAESHGGAVGVASRPGHGSTFWITFPA